MLYKNRTEAGQFLAKQLAAYANRPDVLVLALPRGGVPVAFEVAKALNTPLDVFIVRKLGVPDQKELAMGAIASGGVRILNKAIVQSLNLSEAAINSVVTQEKQELERRERLYRENCPLPVVRGRIVILVDDGLATGATMRAAVVALRKYEPAKIVVAVPVSSPEICQFFKNQAEVDEIICAKTPSPFHSVGLWYEEFPQTTDEEVRNLLKLAKKRYQTTAISK
jgi:putative phosphoribosyl transferase